MTRAQTFRAAIRREDGIVNGAILERFIIEFPETADDDEHTITTSWMTKERADVFERGLRERLSTPTPSDPDGDPGRK